jgi:pyruvate ferredoxin oxidoreductase alpha subunit
MTIGNRAIGAPINIWNDQQDSMSMRDAGWVQLYAETNQEAVDLHIQAFRLAEELSVPVMVCVDGFILTHAYERVDMPTQAAVDGFVPPYEPRQILDPDDPVTIGAMVGPEAFTEVRYLAHYRQMQALWLIPELAEAFAEQFGRQSGGLLHEYRSSDAETIVVALGSVNGTIKDVVDGLREEGLSIGSVSITSFRPFPAKRLRESLLHAKRILVVEKSLAVGIGGIVSTDVRMALAGAGLPVHTVVAGLGGRAITQTSLREVMRKAHGDALQPLTFLDLRDDVIHREIERLETLRRSGPVAENILRELGSVADRIG